MFIYSSGGKWSVLVLLDDLEISNMLLADPKAALDAEYQKRLGWTAAVANAMRTGGKIHLLVKPAAGDERFVRFRGPLHDLPEAYRQRATIALDAIAKKFATAYADAQIDCIADGYAKATPSPPDKTSS